MTKSFSDAELNEVKMNLMLLGFIVNQYSTGYSYYSPINEDAELYIHSYGVIEITLRHNDIWHIVNSIEELMEYINHIEPE